jgi:glycosyltransferase involved in cell wall biosynthesis
MKVVIDARESGTSTGRYVDKLIEYLHLLKPDFDIVVLAKSHRVGYINQVAPKFKVVESNFKEFTFSEQIGFLRQINGLRADLVHFTMVQQPIRYRGRVVTTIADLTTARFRNPTKNWLIFTIKQLVYRWVIKRVAAKSARIIAISRFAKRDIVQFSGVPFKKIAVTYPAADKIMEEALPMAELKGKRFLLYVGRAQPHKNLERLIEAYRLVKGSQPDLLLVIAGKMDANHQLLQKYVDKRQVHGVVFTDFVEDASLRWLYEQAVAYVFPSLSEGFGLPGLEAMLYDLPVISSNATCLPEIYKDGALFFDPLDVDDMAAKIKLVVNDPQLAKNLAWKAGAVVKQYSWRHMVEQTLSVYTKILNK